MVAKTQFAITGEDTRYYLNGALFVLRSDSMTLVATDGHRLALVNARRDPPVEGREEIKAILPRKTLSELSRLLGDGEIDVQYERGENHLFFEIGPRSDLAMIDGQFPAYEKVIPKNNDKRSNSSAIGSRKPFDGSPSCPTNDRVRSSSSSTRAKSK